MKRFNIVLEDGRAMALYYPSADKAREAYPDAVEITENNDFGYVEYIDRMLAAAEKVETAERKGSTVYALKLSTSAGVCLAWLFRDISDGVWYDTCQYQLWKSGAVVVPVCRTMTTPKKFCEQFLFPKAEYTVLCSGGKLPKPVELKGVQKFASVPFAPAVYGGRRYDNMCQLFLNGDDLYIKHACYFPSVETKEIDGEIRTIWYNRRAWLRISNFVPMVKLLNAPEMAYTVWKMIREYHRWDEREYNMEWTRFLELVTNATQKYCSEKAQV